MQPGMDAGYRRATLFVVLLAMMFRLALGGFTGLGIDESYMVAASHRFAASYFDHPLASWWLELASRAVFRSMAPIVVRLPFILLSGVSSFLLFALTRRLYGVKAGFWAVAGYTISPVFSLAFGTWVLPDGPLDAALLGAAYAMVRALGLGENEGEARERWWLLAGFSAGLALLSKYNGALTLAGAGIFLLSEPVSRRELRRFWPWAAVLLALVMFTPVLWWNAVHGWQSFGYQGGRATGLRLHPLAPLTIWGGEALFVLPWVWAPMMLLLIDALRRGPADRRGWLLAMLGIPPILLFSVIGIWSSTRILYHWATPGYLMLFPMLGDWAAQLHGRAACAMRAAAAASAALLAAAAVLMIALLGFSALPWINQRFPPGKSPLLQAINWTSIRRELAARGELDNPHFAIAALRWYDAGKIGYAVQGKIPVTVFGPEPHQFGISAPPASLIGDNVLILAMPGNISAIAAKYRPYFKAILPAPALTVNRGKGPLLVIPVLLGEDLQHAP